MTANTVVQVVLFVVVLLATVKPLGWFMARVYEGNSPAPLRWLAPVERLINRLAGVDPSAEMTWRQYASAVLLFSMVSFLTVYGLQRIQGVLPGNPAQFGAVSPDSAFNTAVSFTTNTNWQGYGGESTMSYTTQMVALTVQNFVSAAAGMAVLVALIRGFTRHNSPTIGNFWADLNRGVLYILMPFALVLALALVSQGVVQTFRPYQQVSLVEPVAGADGQPVVEQTIPVGPVASQVAIKQLGTNGGGYFNTNSAHPLENPTPLANFLELVAILILPTALCFTFGEMVGDRRQGWTVLAAMTVIFVPLLILTLIAEQRGNPALARAGIDQVASESQAGGNMEGKEVRFGVVNSAVWSVATTAASNGSVNAMHDSFTPLGGLAPLWLMQLGEVIYGGVGSGLYGMLVFGIVAVFIAGLMVGRTPRVPRQEDWRLRDEDGLAGDPLAVRHGPPEHRGRCHGGCRQGGHHERWTPRLQRGLVCDLIGIEQQRECVCWPGGQHAVLQRAARASDAGGPVRGDDPGPGDRRLAGRQEACTRRRRDAANAYPVVRCACWSLWSSWSGALSFFPSLALGPIVEQLLANRA